MKNSGVEVPLLPETTSVPRTKTHGICWVLFDYTSDDIANLQAYAKNECDYMIFGREICPTTGRPHLQGYHHYENARIYPNQKFRDAIGLVGRGKDFYARGSPESNQKYSMKEGDSWEYGTPPKQGKRADWERALQQLRESSVLDVIQEQPHLLPMVGALLKTKNLLSKSTHRNVQVYVLVGATGTGKSRAAWDAHPDLFSKPEGEWWDGYNGEKVVLFDDFCGGVRLATFLKWIDRYPVQLPVKGSFTPALYEKVIITSNRNPDQWFPDACARQLQALIRRFACVHSWKNEFSVMDITNAIQNQQESSSSSQEIQIPTAQEADATQTHAEGQ